MKPNNLIAMFIAVTLIVIGVALAVIKHQSPAPQEAEDAVPLDIRSPEDTGKANTLSQVALIHADIGAPAFDTQAKSELQKIRDSIDWTGQTACA